MDSRGTQTYGYDPANQLNDAIIGGATTSYIYNGDGVRTARETSSTYTEYVIDHNRSLPVILYDETAFYVWGLDLIARIVGSTQQYYHYDGLGSTRALTGNTGTTLATYNYDAFGAVKSQTGSQTNNFLFTGEWRDPETGFYFLRARYYDPVVGRFINRDPWPGNELDPQSLNTYAYASNNPTNLVDPSGLAFAQPELLSRKAAAAGISIGEYIRRFCEGLRDLCLGPRQPAGSGGGSTFRWPWSRGAVSTARFADQNKLLDHFQRHGKDFGTTTPADYQAKASNFLTGRPEKGVLEISRTTGETVRYNPVTEEFGVISPNGTVQTYFKPDPTIHPYPTNMDYFNAQRW